MKTNFRWLKQLPEVRLPKQRKLDQREQRREPRITPSDIVTKSKRIRLSIRNTEPEKPSEVGFIAAN